MSNPGAHASHANTYSHGASSVPASKSKKDGHGSSRASATATTSGSVSSPSPSGSNSARESLEAAERRSHEPSARRSSNGSDRPAAEVASSSSNSSNRNSSSSDVASGVRRSSLRRASGDPASMISVATPLRPAVVLSASELGRGSASSSTAPSPSHANTISAITAYPTKPVATERRASMEHNAAAAAAGVGRTDVDRSDRGAAVDRDSRASKPASVGAAAGGSFVTATTASAARYSGNEAGNNSGSSTRASSAAGGSGAVRSDGAVVADVGAAPPRASPSSTLKPSPSTSASTAAAAAAAAGSSSSASKKPPKPLSKKKAQLLAEQAAVVDVASTAAALLQERRELEARILARENTRVAQQAHDSKVNEASRLYEEAQADSLFEQERAGFIRALEEQVYEQQQWDAYLACNPLPDVRDDVQLNAFVSVFREPDTTNAPHLSLQPTLDACAQAEEVVSELLRRCQEAKEEKDEATVVRAQTYRDLLRGLMASKLDQLTCKFLAKTDEYETGRECAFTVAARSVGGDPATSHGPDGDDGLAEPATAPTEKIGFGLWVHSSSRTDRIKRIDFHSSVTALTAEDPSNAQRAPSASGMDVSIELPQSLQKARTCIRLVRTLYDAVSLLPSPTATIATATAAPAALARSSSALVRSVSTRPGTRGANHASISAGGEGSTDALSPSSSSGGDESLLDPTSLFDFSRRPPLVCSSRTHFVSLGGVLDLSQLLLPAQPKRLRNWTLRDITSLDHHIVPVPYPSEEAIAAAKTSTAGSGGGAGTGAAGANASSSSSSSSAAALAPLRVRFTLPAHIFLPEDREPLFGYWDRDYPNQVGDGPALLGAWRQDGVSILEFDPATRAVSLSLPTIKPLAAIQPRALDFPYRSWSILPAPVRDTTSMMAAAPGPSVEDFSSVAAHTCRIEVAGSRFALGIEVSGLVCRLVSPLSVVNFLASTRTRKPSSSASAGDEYWSSPGSLLADLGRAGVNVCPSDEDAGYCRKPLKHSVLVQTLHEHLSLLTTVFDVASSPHNMSRPANVAMVRMRLSRHSMVLASAAARKAVVDWEAREAEAERTGAPDRSYEDFPDALRSHEPIRDENGNEIPPSNDANAARQQQALIDAEIAALEADDVAAASAQAEAARQVLAKVAADDAEALSRSTSAKAHAKRSKNTALEDHVPQPKPAELTQQQKYGEWTAQRAAQPSPATGECTSEGMTCFGRVSPCVVLVSLCCAMCVVRIQMLASSG